MRLPPRSPIASSYFLLRLIYGHAKSLLVWRRRALSATYQSASDHVLRDRYKMAGWSRFCAQALRCASPCGVGNAAFAASGCAIHCAYALFVYGRGCKEIGDIDLAPGRIRVRCGALVVSPSLTATRTPWKSSPYLRCALSKAVAHLLESLTFARLLLERLTLTCHCVRLRCCSAPGMTHL